MTARPRLGRDRLGRDRLGRSGFGRMALLLALALTLGLAACGKKGAPQAPGPKDKIIYPLVYPPY